MREPRRVTEADFRRWEQYPQTRHMTWHEKWAVCKQNDRLLSRWEQDFITNLREPRYWNRDLVSNKQFDRFDVIYDRLLVKHHVHYRANHLGAAIKVVVNKL